MKVTSKQQFDAIQYTSVEVIRDFADKRGIATTLFGDNIIIGTKETGCGLSPGEWLVVVYYLGDSVCSAFSDEAFKERYTEPFTQEEKDFIAQADLRSQDRTENSARIKQSILDKL